MTSINDDSTLDRSRQGDKTATAVLFANHHAWAVRFAKRLGCQDPEDIASEAFACTLAAIGNGAGPRDNFRSYLASAIRSAQQKSWRNQEYPSDPHADDWETATSKATTSVEDQICTREQVRKVLRPLPRRSAEILWSVAALGESPTEVGARFHTTGPAVSSLVYRTTSQARSGSVDSAA